MLCLLMTGQAVWKLGQAEGGRQDVQIWASAATCLVVGCSVDSRARLGVTHRQFFPEGASVLYGVVFPLEAELDAPESACGHLVRSVCMSEVCAGNMVMLISWGMCAGDMGARLSERLCEGPHIMLMSVCGLWSICESAE